ncbi:MAG TPA: hypothetical protein VH107_03560 [Lacipirellulaceae bacterium]|nr:hypothetical protein [Lacipirellulaceae bacterium]
MRNLCQRKRLYRSLLALVVFAWIGRCDSRATANEDRADSKISRVEVGFNNFYKLGFWTPVLVEVTGLDGAAEQGLRVSVTVSDSDGVPTTAIAALPTSNESQGRPSIAVYTQIGRIGSSVQVSLLAGDREIDSRTLVPSGKQNVDSVLHPLAATSELVVSLGPAAYGLTEAVGNRTASGGHVGRRVLSLADVASLPNESYGYDDVDVLIIPAGDGKACRKLAADKPKLAAIERWVESGGRLVVLCDGKNAPAMLGNDGPLASFLPGKYVGTIRLPETSSLERFAVSTAITGGAVEVPQIAEVRGNIEAYAGNRAAELPLVIRAPRGFGEIAFAGVEFDAPPLSLWGGRILFLRTLLQPYLRGADSNDTTQKLVASGSDDLSGALRQRLGRGFSAVMPVGFSIVAALAIAYLIFLGPLDFLLIQRWLRKPLFAWVSLPLIIALFTAIALVIAERSKGPPGVRLNCLELDDFDTIGGQARGTLWTTLYSPETTELNIAVRPRTAAISPTDSTPKILFSWWGLPGIGIGGMQSATSDLGLIRNGYEYGPEMSSLARVPVLASGAKSLLARWSRSAPPMMGAHLSDVDGLIAGTITNNTGAKLHNARLLYGSWAYRLGTLSPGERVEVSDQLNPRRVKTIVTREALGDSGSASTPMESRVFSAEQASPIQILNLMMFYEAAGGTGFGHLPNRYQSYCDLSRQLELGRAILVAENADGQVRLVDSGTDKQIGSGDLNSSAVIQRFILPVEKPSTP